MPVRTFGWSADALCFGLFGGLLATLVARIAATVDGAVDVMLLLLAALAGWGVTDLVSGIVHWFCDSFFDEDTPGIGPALIGPFREHHRDPLAMTRAGFLEVNRSNYIVMVPILAAALWRDCPAPGVSPPFGHAFLLFFAVAVALTNQFHKWAHAPRVPRLVGWLHAARLAVGPAHHARHHASGGRRAFCVTTGWWNPVLDRLRVFDGLARVVECRRSRANRGHRRIPLERESAVAIVQGWRCRGTPSSPTRVLTPDSLDTTLPRGCASDGRSRLDSQAHLR